MPPPTKASTTSLKDKIVLITGASAGIGEACAWRFAEQGSKLILLARRQEKLEALRDDILHHYPSTQIHLVCMDVREWGRVEKLPSELPEDFRAVDVLVNNAGLALGVSPGHEQDLEDLKVMIDTNVTSLMFFTRVFVPGMCERDHGHVINISSIAGKEYYGGGSVYCGTKAAVQGTWSIYLYVGGTGACYLHPDLHPEP